MREELVMVARGTPPECEAEPVTVYVLGPAVMLTLDDGEPLTFDAGELVGAIARLQAVERRSAA
jgi:hypothetical protein